MYKHQVIGIRRARSWRSRKSEHIVGICTMEAVCGSDRFKDFTPTKDWQAAGCAAGAGKTAPPKSAPSLRCRYWSLEEVVDAIAGPAPQHEFYTRHPGTQAKISVFSFQGQDRRWIKTAGDSKNPGNLQNLPATVVPCPMHGCPVIPLCAGSISRGDVPDC